MDICLGNLMYYVECIQCKILKNNVNIYDVGNRMEEIFMLEFIEYWIKYVIFFISEVIGIIIMINK